jgi:hypothetical protein
MQVRCGGSLQECKVITLMISFAAGWKSRVHALALSAA